MILINIISVWDDLLCLPSPDEGRRRGVLHRLHVAADDDQVGRLAQPLQLVHRILRERREREREADIQRERKRRCWPSPHPHLVSERGRGRRGERVSGRVRE